MSEETKIQKAERLLNVGEGHVLSCAAVPHPNGIEFSAHLADGGFVHRTVGSDHWAPKPFTHTAQRLVVGEKVVGQEKVGQEQVGVDGEGQPLFRDVLKDKMGPALEGDDAISARVLSEAREAATKRGWRRASFEAPVLTVEGASVTVSCG